MSINWTTGWNFLIRELKLAFWTVWLFTLKSMMAIASAWVIVHLFLWVANA